MAKYEGWSPELEAALAEPFPAEWVKQKKAGKGDKAATISFVPWYRYVLKLNQLVGSGWSMGTPITVHLEGKLLMAVPVTIFGVTRINWGDEDDSETEEVLNKQTGEMEEKRTMYGSSATNAFAQAFKRTCALFGMGLDLYDKGGARSDSGRSASAPSARDGFSLDQIAPGKKANGRTWRELLDSDRGFVEWAVKSMTTLAPDAKTQLQAALSQNDAPVSAVILLENEMNKAASLGAITDDQEKRIQGVVERGDSDEVRIARDWLSTQIEKKRLGG